MPCIEGEFEPKQLLLTNVNLTKFRVSYTYYPRIVGLNWFEMTRVKRYMGLCRQNTPKNIWGHCNNKVSTL